MEFPRVLRPNEFRLVDLQLLLFNVPCHSVDPIAGGGGGVGGWVVLNRSVGIYMTPDEFRPSLMFYTANSLSFSFSFRHARSRFRVSCVSFDGLRKERLLVVC